MKVVVSSVLHWFQNDGGPGALDDATKATTSPAGMSWQWRWYVAILAAYLGLLANAVVGVLRLASPLASAEAMLWGQSLPIVLVLLAVVMRRGVDKFLGAMLAFPLLMLSLVLGFFCRETVSDIRRTGSDPSFKPIDSIAVRHSRIVLYRGNGGATTPFSVVLRQEKLLIPGVLLVRRVRTVSPASEAEVTVLGDDRIRFVVASYARDETLTVKRWVYF